MNLTTLLDKIAGRQQERRQAREADFRQLVTQVADGDEPEPEEIEHILGANQKTIADLRDAVELLQRRRELRRTVDLAPELAKERADIEKRIAKADRIFKQADAKHDETVDPLHARLRQIRSLVVEAEHARFELWETCRDAELLRRLEEVSRPGAELSHKLSVMETKASHLRDEARYEREQAAHAERAPNAEAHKEEAARCEAEAKQLEREIPALRRQVEELTYQEAEIHEQMLVP